MELEKIKTENELVNLFCTLAEIPSPSLQEEKVIEYIDIEIEKETKRVMKLLPRISYTIIGIVLFLFLIIVLIPCIQVYLSGFLFI